MRSVFHQVHSPDTGRLDHVAKPVVRQKPCMVLYGRSDKVPYFRNRHIEPVRPIDSHLVPFLGDIESRIPFLLVS